MDTETLDELDMSILHLLQEDARHETPVDIAEKLPVTDQTVRNRIQDLEERGIIEGYAPNINYEKAGFPIRLQFTCTAPVQERAELAEAALEISNVVRVEEMLSAKENVQVLAIAREAEVLNEITEQLDELGLTIESERLQRRGHLRPFNHFGTNMISSE